MPHHPPYDEKELLFRIADGDTAAVKVFFEMYYSRLSFFAGSLIHHPQEAQDFAQEALVSFWQKRADFRGASLQQAEAFLFTVIRNKCYNLIKHRKMRMGKETELLSGAAFEAEAEARFIQEDVFNRVYKEIQQLPVAQAQLLKMIFVEELGTDEIAEKLGITPNNVRNQKARALEKIRALILRKGLLITLLLIFSLFFKILVMPGMLRLFT